jgi:hypothetical protein
VLTTVVSVRGLTPGDFFADPRAVYVGRAVKFLGWKGSPWGNPFKVYTNRFGSFNPKMVNYRWLKETRDAIGELPPAEMAVELYSRWLRSQPDYLAHVPELRGRVLGCWCGFWEPGEPKIACHAVVLAQLANALTPEPEQASA